MKICLIGVFPETQSEVRGGVANVILYLAQGLSGCGNEIHIISAGAKEKSVVRRDEITVHYVKIPRFLPRVLANATVIRQAIHRKICEIEPDICHFQGVPTYMFGYKKPCVFTLHGVSEMDIKYVGGLFSWAKSILLRTLEKYSRRQVKYFIIINKYLLDVIGDDIKGRRWIIENPVDPMFYEITPIPKKNIFYAGMINKRKNILGLLRIFKKVHDCESEAKLRIAGPVRDHKYMQKCVSYIKANNLNNHVEFIGNLNPSQVAEELKSSTCTILVSYQETAPLFISESMAAGVPVVASDVGGNRYMVEHGITGYIEDVDNIDAFSDAILIFLKNPEFTKKMGDAAKQAANELFSVKNVVEKSLNVYDYIINE